MEPNTTTPTPVDDEPTEEEIRAFYESFTGRIIDVDD